MTKVVRRLALLALSMATMLAAPIASADDSGDIVIVSTKGEVHITLNGVARKLRVGGVLELPATLRTGPDGAVDLRQEATTVSVGPDTLLEFPAPETRGAPVERIVQPRGNAFYNVGKREGRKLRIETPYLVGMIKGTQFNVAVQDGTTTISLFEGLLDVRSTGDGEAIDLKAGEIASRKNGDKSISIMKMDGVKPAPTGARAPATTSSNIAESDDESMLVVSNLGIDTLASPDVRTSGPVDAAPEIPGAGAGAGAVDVPAVIDVAGPAVDVGTDAVVGAGPAADVDVTIGTDDAVGTVDVGVPVADVDLDVDLGLDDGNNGHGNDDDGSDSSNPGRGGKGHGKPDTGSLLDSLIRNPNKK